jgi:predicted RNA-binding Zn ribbon-like protein
MPKAKKFEIEGSALALDFVNTNHFWDGDPPQEDLASYPDLLQWAIASEAIPQEQGVVLQRRIAKNRRAAERAFKAALELRESLYRIFQAVLRGESPPARHLDRYNAVLSKALAHQRLSANRGRFEWSWDKDDNDLLSVLWPVLRSAADLLTSHEAGKIRQCGGQTCTWMFVDRSRNGLRRWCDMSKCGNRDKAKRFRQRSS